MLFQVLCGFEPVFYTTHPNEEPEFLINTMRMVSTRELSIRVLKILNSMLFKV